MSGAAEGGRLPSPVVLLSIIIVNWNTKQDLMGCLASIMASPPSVPFEVIVFDNASKDGSPQAVAEAYPQVRLVVSQENLGFARGNNRAAELAQGRFWLLLNPDTVVHPGSIDALVDYIRHRPHVAAVGPRLENSDGSLQASLERLPSLFREWWRLFHLDRLYPVSQYPKAVLTSTAPQRAEVLSGACLVLRADIVRSLGLFDEEYFVYSEETDLCDRLREGKWELHWLPTAGVTHFGGQSTNQIADQMFLELYRNKVKFFRKRRGALAAILYKFILLQASLARLGLSMLGNLVSPRRGEVWGPAARRYRSLLAAIAFL